MDKNTLIGFLLIGVVLFAFSWFNRPTPEHWRRNVVTKIQSRRLSMPSNWNAETREQKCFSGGFVGERAGLGKGATFAAELRRIRRSYGGYGRLHDPTK